MTTFQMVCQSSGWEVPVPEYQFALPRQWKFDWAFPTSLVALEIEGGIWTQGRHTRGKGFLKDMEKYNEATILGWRLLRCTPKQFESGDVIALLERIMTDGANNQRSSTDTDDAR